MNTWKKQVGDIIEEFSFSKYDDFVEFYNASVGSDVHEFSASIFEDDYEVPEEVWSDWVYVDDNRAYSLRPLDASLLGIATQIMSVDHVYHVSARSSNLGSLELMVTGGSPLKIAKKISNCRPAVINTIGNTCITFTDACGLQRSEQFNYIYK